MNAKKDVLDKKRFLKVYCLGNSKKIVTQKELNDFRDTLEESMYRSEPIKTSIPYSIVNVPLEPNYIIKCGDPAKGIPVSNEQIEDFKKICAEALKSWMVVVVGFPVTVKIFKKKDMGGTK